jgi:DNA-directed RNA polymerase I subunit RPA2
MLILKALTGASDKEIFEGIMMQDYENTFLTDRVELLLRSFKMYNLYTGDQCLEYLGDKFRVVLGLPEDWNNKAVGVWLVQKLVLVHIDSAREKSRMLLYVWSLPAHALMLILISFMLRKLYALVSKECCVDNPDSPQNQEVLLPGSLYGMIIKERLEEALNQVRTQVTIDVQKGQADFLDSGLRFFLSSES